MFFCFCKTSFFLRFLRKILHQSIIPQLIYRAATSADVAAAKLPHQHIYHRSAKHTARICWGVILQTFYTLFSVCCSELTSACGDCNWYTLPMPVCKSDCAGVPVLQFGSVAFCLFAFVCVPVWQSASLHVCQCASLLVCLCGSSALWLYQCTSSVPMAVCLWGL